jgi:hypothetical protein
VSQLALRNRAGTIVQGRRSEARAGEAAHRERCRSRRASPYRPDVARSAPIVDHAPHALFHRFDWLLLLSYDDFIVDDISTFSLAYDFLQIANCSARLHSTNDQSHKQGHDKSIVRWFQSKSFDCPEFEHALGTLIKIVTIKTNSWPTTQQTTNDAYML